MARLLLFVALGVHAQADSLQAVKIDSTTFKRIYPHALRGNLDTVFGMLENAEDRALTQLQKEEKDRYRQRFLFLNEDFDYNTEVPEIIDLFKRFQNYWRSIMVENVDQDLADRLFRDEMTYFLKKYYQPVPTVAQIRKDYYTMFQDFFRSKNMYGLGVGKTGHLFDLYLWKDQEEKEYEIALPEGQMVKVPVVFMRDFVSNGWAHYTTFGHSFSGGWATREKLFCVEESYGPKDEEEFLISYITHEGQHFSDYKVFPKLRQVDLEYRAKLAELSLAKETVFQILQKFVSNAKNDSSYAHGFANYTVVKRLSQSIFNSKFESDIEKWKQIPVPKINRLALRLLKENTKSLKALGAETVDSGLLNLSN